MMKTRTPGEDVRVNGVNYTIGCPLGSGGFGEVYAAASSTGRPVAFKQIETPKVPISLDAHSLVHKARRALRGVAPEVLGWSYAEEAVVMGLITGRTEYEPTDLNLAQRAPYIRTLLMDVLVAMQSFRDAGLAHLDLKPSNLMRAKDGKLWVIDYDRAGAFGTNRWDQPYFLVPPELSPTGANAIYPESDMFALGCLAACFVIPDSQDDVPPFNGNPENFFYPAPINSTDKNHIRAAVKTNRAVRARDADAITDFLVGACQEHPGQRLSIEDALRGLRPKILVQVKSTLLCA
jgi:serine/threonine protein kinase